MQINITSWKWLHECCQNAKWRIDIYIQCGILHEATYKCNTIVSLIVVFGSSECCFFCLQYIFHYHFSPYIGINWISPEGDMHCEISKCASEVWQRPMWRVYQGRRYKFYSYPQLAIVNWLLSQDAVLHRANSTSSCPSSPPSHYPSPPEEEFTIRVSVVPCSMQAAM